MRRRDFIKVTVGSAAAWPVTARAQQPAMPVIGFLSFRSANESAGAEAAFREGLSEIGYSEGRNVHIAFRWAEGQTERLPGLAGRTWLITFTSRLSRQPEEAPRRSWPKQRQKPYRSFSLMPPTL